MIDRTSLLSSLNAKSQPNLSNLGVVQRLIARTQNQAPKVAGEAVDLQIGKKPTLVDHSSDIGAVKARGIAAYQAQLTRPVEPENLGIFAPGKTISGLFSGGQLKASTGEKGSYEAFSAAGPIKFKLGDYEGYALSDSTGVAWNPKTKESYTFSMKLDGEQFEFSNIKSMKSADLVKQPSFAEGKVVGDQKSYSVEFGKGFNMKVSANGEVLMEMTSAGAKVMGKGYLDSNGNMIVAFDNGATIQAAYKMEGGIFKIQGYKLLGAGGKDFVAAQDVNKAPPITVTPHVGSTSIAKSAHVSAHENALRLGEFVNMEGDRE